jgi:hypothetical protein
LVFWWGNLEKERKEKSVNLCRGRRKIEGLEVLGLVRWGWGTVKMT